MSKDTGARNLVIGSAIVGSLMGAIILSPFVYAHLQRKSDYKSEIQGAYESSPVRLTHDDKKEIMFVYQPGANIRSSFRQVAPHVIATDYEGDGTFDRIEAANISPNDKMRKYLEPSELEKVLKFIKENGTRVNVK